MHPLASSVINYTFPPPPTTISFLTQRSLESCTEVQVLLIRVIELENENRLLREKTAAETEELQTENDRIRADMTIMRVS